MSACPLCAACQTSSRPRVEQEFVLIHLPEVSQAALIHLTRSCHLIFHAHGEAPHMARRPRSDTLALRAAYRAFQSLLTLVPQADAHVGTSSPRDLEAVLASLTGDRRCVAERQISGLRMLPLGHLFKDGRDIYPDILDAWTASNGPFANLDFTKPEHTHDPRYSPRLA